MTHKANAASMVWTGGKGGTRAPRRVVLVVLGLVVVALAVASVYLLLVGAQPAVGTGVAAGEEASTARWAAIGGHYSRDCAAVAAVDAARWSALGEAYRSRVAAGTEASSARWTALGEAYLSRYEAAAGASAARYQAMAEAFAEEAAAAK